MLNKSWHNVGAVILAAGKGTRLNCVDMPKVMLAIGGRPIVSYVVSTLEKMGFAPEQICLVVGYKKEVVMDYFDGRATFAVQAEQLGTAHAAFTGMKKLPSQIEQVLVMGGDDSAFYHATTLEKFIAGHLESGASLSLLSAMVDNPGQLGRVVRRADGQIEIIEKEYLTEEQKKIKEISTGTFCFRRGWFEKIFPAMPPLRKLGEFGLPTALAMARASGEKYKLVTLDDSMEWFGVNTPEELAEADRRKKNDK